MPDGQISCNLAVEQTDKQKQMAQPWLSPGRGIMLQLGKNIAALQ